MKNVVTQLFHYRIVRFALTGGLATLTHLAIAFLFLRFFSPSVFVANLLGFSGAFGLSYLLQSLFVFKTSLSLKNAQRFFIVQFSALLISQLVSELFNNSNSYLRVLLVVLLIPFVTYLIHKMWTYKESSLITSESSHED